MLSGRLRIRYVILFFNVSKQIKVWLSADRRRQQVI